MTILDLLNAGIYIQGKVVVRLFVDDEQHGEREINNEAFYDLPKRWLDKEIHYMYAIDGVGLVIEIMDFTD